MKTETKISNEVKAKTRDEIESIITSHTKEIKRLKTEIIELRKEALLMSDDEQWYTEVIITETKKVNRKKVTEQNLIGYVNWKQDFKDESTGEIITIERCEAIRRNGEWI